MHDNKGQSEKTLLHFIFTFNKSVKTKSVAHQQPTTNFLLEETIWFYLKTKLFESYYV